MYDFPVLICRVYAKKKHKKNKVILIDCKNYDFHFCFDSRTYVLFF